MRYAEFRNCIRNELQQVRAGGLTWAELKSRLDLPYPRPCPSWVKRMEADIGLRRERGPGRALVWRLDR